MLRQLALLGALLTPALVAAQWTSTLFTDGQGFLSIRCHGGTGLGGAYGGLPAYWSTGTPGSLILYSIPGNTGLVAGMNASHQVGSLSVSLVGSAFMWSGSSASGVNFNPPGASGSLAYSVSNTLVGGYAMFSGYPHAGIWNIGNQIFMDFHPGGSFSQSQIFSVSDTEQVGILGIGANSHAALWYGTAGSLVDLNPIGASYSVAVYTDGTHEVGYAHFADGTHCGYWNGTAASWVDTTPAGLRYTIIYATDGQHFIGSATTSDNRNILAYWSVGDGFYSDLTAVLAGLGDTPASNSDTPNWGAVWGQNGEVDLAVNAWKNPGVYMEAWVLKAHTLQISGTVTLQNYQHSAVGGTPVTIEIRSPGSTTPLETHTVALGGSGTFIFSTLLPAGTYDIAAKASHWLRQTQTGQVVTSGGLNGLSFSLKNGDINGDNTVSLPDFGLLRNAYGSSVGDANYSAAADLDGDGSVSLVDFGILKLNYGTSGDP